MKAEDSFSYLKDPSMQAEDSFSYLKDPSMKAEDSFSYLKDPSSPADSKRIAIVGLRRAMSKPVQPNKNGWINTLPMIGTVRGAGFQ